MSDQITALPTSLPEGLEWPSQPCDCEAFALCPGGCRLPDHHPGGTLEHWPGGAGPCGQMARYGVRLRHQNRCDGTTVRLLCQRCLDYIAIWVAVAVPKCPPLPCGCRLALADLVGPVMPL